MPPHTLSKTMLDTVRSATHALARELKVIGLMNVRFDQGQPAVRAGSESPRFTHGALRGQGHRRAARETRRESHDRAEAEGPRLHPRTDPEALVREGGGVSLVTFPGATIMLGPEMRSTGEVMGLDEDLGVAFAKAQAAAKPGLPTGGNVFLSVKDADKPRVVDIARQLEALGFAIYSTGGTAKVLAENGVKVSKLAKIEEGRPTAVDLIKNGQIQLVINTPAGMIPRKDENKIRSAPTRTMSVS